MEHEQLKGEELRREFIRNLKEKNLYVAFISELKKQKGRNSALIVGYNLRNLNELMAVLLSKNINPIMNMINWSISKMGASFWNDVYINYAIGK